MMKEDAFKAIYEQYWSKLYSVCFYTVASREAAEDMVMEIFLSLWHNREKLEIENLEHYLVRAAKNKALKYLIKQKRKAAQLHKMIHVMGVEHTIHAPENRLEMKELAASISNSLTTLPQKTKEIFLLNREQGLTYPEIARHLGVSVKTVEYHISKALRVLNRVVLTLSTFFFLK
jgi:RNA polymerase sigma-70 factor (family 1)